MSRTKREGELGLRDIEALNDAMLAKISWRIICNPESLLARVLLGKYCRERDFLNVEATSDCSHGWRGVLLGRDVIKDGLSFAIGNGENVKIWEDPWLSLDEPRRLQGPATQESCLWTVSKLFHEGTIEWDREKVRHLCPEREDEIMRIKPSGLGAKDKIFWTYGRCGQYQTRQGYYQAIKRSRGSEEGIEHEEQFDWMKHIWKVETAPKISLFLWKAKRKALPVDMNLMERRVIEDGSCPRCGEAEDTTHTLFHCGFAKEVWSAAPFKALVRTEEWTSFEAGLEGTKLMTALPPAGVAGDTLFASLCWNIWTSGNKKVFEQRNLGVLEVCTQALIDAREWTNAQEIKKEEERTKEKMKVELVRNRDKREEATSLVSTDAAWEATTGNAGMGWTIKNRGETRSITGEKRSVNVRSSLMAEAMACLEALKHLKAIDRNKVTVSSDSLNLIRALTKNEYPMEIYGVVSDIMILAKEFEFVCFSFVPRRENAEADSLAKMALQHDSLEVVVRDEYFV